MKYIVFILTVFSLVFITESKDSVAKTARKIDKSSIIINPVIGNTADTIIKPPSNSDPSVNTMPFFYSRSDITLVRKSIPDDLPPLLPWSNEPQKLDPKMVFDVEIRDGMSMYNQNNLIDMNGYGDQNGLMMVFSKSEIQPIIPSNQYAPVDILFINSQGTITQIVPNIILSELEDTIYPNDPVLAFLFIRGGSSSELYINVGDEIEYSAFKKPRVILNAPRKIPVKEVPNPNVYEAPPTNTQQPPAPQKQEKRPVNEPVLAPISDNNNYNTINILQQDPSTLQRRLK